MQLNKPIYILVLLTLFITAVLFVGTTLIPRQGDFVVNGTKFNDPTYRDVRGVPFVFLKRSLADRECNIQDVQIQTCDPSVGNEPYQILLGDAMADAMIWLGVSVVVTNLLWRGYQRITTKSEQS